MTMFGRRHWIPPGALIFSQLAHGTSWVLLAYIAAQYGVVGASGAAIGWIHVVALGWFTMAALGILIHVVPGFTDVRWRYESVARGALVPFGLGIVLFVAGWFVSPYVVFAGALTIVVSLVVYCALAWTTLRKAGEIGKTEGAIARAFTINLTFLLVVALLGLGMSAAFIDGRFAQFLTRIPIVHANFALYGWLTMLVFGVSARTMRPICGARSRFPRIHAIVGASVLVGPILFAVGIGTGYVPSVWAGALVLGGGIAAYVFDILDIVRRRTVAHRPPQAFVVASVTWLVIASLLGLGVLLGEPWQNAFVFAMLAGWTGQMVNAHFFHIGVRLMATVLLGEENETRPADLLDARLSWIAFAGMQLALALCVYGASSGAAGFVLAGALCGFCAWLAMPANMIAVRLNVRHALRTVV